MCMRQYSSMMAECNALIVTACFKGGTVQNVKFAKQINNIIISQNEETLREESPQDVILSSQRLITVLEGILPRPPSRY